VGIELENKGIMKMNENQAEWAQNYAEEICPGFRKASQACEQFMVKQIFSEQEQERQNFFVELEKDEPDYDKLCNIIIDQDRQDKTT